MVIRGSVRSDEMETEKRGVQEESISGHSLLEFADGWRQYSDSAGMLSRPLV